MYGQTALSLAPTLRVSVQQAEEWIAGFYRGYPGVAHFVADIKSRAETSGFVATYFDRRRRLPLAHGTAASSQRQHALRQAVNFVVQGTAADLNKLALVQIYRNLPPFARVLFNIHDAVLLLLPRDGASTVLGPLQALMEEPPPGWIVPLRTSATTGRSWHECKHPARREVSTI